MLPPALLALALALLLPAGAARAETLGDAQVGFSAERVLILDGKSFTGRIWNMPGEQRHEQDLPAAKSAFILHSDSEVGDIVLPELHTVVEFVMPKVLSLLGEPGRLGKPVGQDKVNGIATTKYAVDRDIPEGHLAGALWLSRDGIPMKCEGSFTRKSGKVSTVRWELRHVEIGRQDAALFEVPTGYSKLSPEAASTLLGLRVGPHRAH